MIKNLLILVVGLIGFQAANAQRDTTIYYFKNSGKTVPVKDSADYYRVILPPDTNTQSGLFRVYDYYSNGKTKMTGTSTNVSVILMLDGVSKYYYLNGRLKMTSLFTRGLPVDSLVFYYPNGKLYAILKLEDMGFGNYYDYYRDYFPIEIYHNKIRFKELRDSLGKLLAADGNGRVLLYDSDFNKILMQGDLKSNKKEGDWIGPIADSGKFVCTYHNDELKSGVSYLNSGNHYNFKKIYVQPVFSDGIDVFNLFIKKNLQYPESARAKNVSGAVDVEFYVETNGTLSDITVTRSLEKNCDDEAVRVISMSPLWIPAYRFGVPVRTLYRMPVYFSKL